MATPLVHPRSIFRRNWLKANFAGSVPRLVDRIQAVSVPPSTLLLPDTPRFPDWAFERYRDLTSTVVLRFVIPSRIADLLLPLG